MAENTNISISNLQVTNIGNGKTVELSWSVPDPALVKYFIVEMKDMSSRKWTPYDNFHGFVSDAHNKKSIGPPQKISFDVPFYDATMSFRVKAVDKSGNETDWIYGSSEIKVSGSEYAETNQFFVKDGLLVEKSVGMNVTVRPGTAYLGGKRILKVQSTNIRLPDTVDVTYAIYINPDGVISYCPWDTNLLVSKSIRLAKVLVAFDGYITVTDTRFLWAPEDLLITYDSSLGIFQYSLDWTGYKEVNLRGWRIYRAPGSPMIEPALEDFKPIGNAEADVSAYDDAAVITGQAYYYRVRATDWGNNESPFGPAAYLSVPSADYLVPAIPTGLSGVGGGSVGDFYIDLTWAHNSESNLGRYNLWYKNPFMDDWQLLASVPAGINQYRHYNIPNGMTFTYCISAENKLRASSPRSDSVSVVAGDISVPDRVDWSFVNPISSDFLGYGEHGAQTCWIKLRWDQVTTNDDGSSILDLDHYRIYDSSVDPKSIISVIQSNQLTEWTGNSFLAGTSYKFVITAVDRSGNESVDSIERTIVAGGLVPKSPTNVIVQASGSNSATISFDKVTQYTDDTEISIPGGIDGYIIYRGFDWATMTEVGRVPVQNPQIDRYQYQDNGLSGTVTYYYAVSAFRKNAISDMSEVVSVEAGDSIPPAVPVWSSLTARLNDDSSIDNILDWDTSQESDLKGTWIYVMRSDIGFYEPLQFIPKREDGVYKFIHSRIISQLTYTYQLRTEDDSGNLSSPTVRSISTEVAFRPSAPIVSAVGFFDGTSGVNLSWDEVTTNDEATPTPVVGLRGYRIYRSSQNLGYKLIADIQAGSASYEYPDTDLKNGQSYSYKVTSYNSVGTESYPCIIDSVIAGDTTQPAQPVVVLIPIFSPTSSVIATIDLAISCPGSIDHYNVYTSNDGIRWSAPQIVPYNSEGSDYIYTVPYGSYTYYRVSAVSIPGTEGPCTEDFFHVLYSIKPTDIQVEDISIQYEPRGNNFFDAILTWDYSPTGSELDYFESYSVLYGATTPVVLTEIKDSKTKTFRVQGLPGGSVNEFAVIAQNVFGVQSDPHWVIGAPNDTTIPKPPGFINASSKVLAIGVEWGAVTENTDESSCIDLSNYVLEISNDSQFGSIHRTINIPSVITNYLYDTSDHVLWYFRVKAVDSFGHDTPWVVSSGARSIDITDFVGGGIVPDDPEIKVPLETGVTWQLDNAVTPNILYGDEPDVWIKLRWLQVANADHYKIYMSEDNDIYYQVGTCRDPGINATPVYVDFIAHDLFPNTVYYFKITASNKFNDEGPFSQTVSFLSSTVVRPIDSPTNFGANIGKNLIATHWDIPISMNNVVGSVLERRWTTDPRGGARIWSNWEVIYVGKGSYYIDTPLEYNKFYQYRVAIVDSAGNMSNYSPSDYLDRDYQPGQVGNEDIAANAIHGNQIYANTINAINIATDAIETRHLKSGIITAGKIAAGAIRAQDLSITVGGYNYILNSAFGMADFQDNLGLNWNISGSGASVEIDSGLPTNTPYCLKIFKQYEISEPISVTQPIPVLGMDGQMVTLSYDRWTQNITGIQAKVRLVVVTATGTTYLADDPIIGTTDGWVRSSQTLTMPNGVISINLEITMYGTSTGVLKVTRIQLEDGDLVTQWNPNGDEVYGAEGKVQINSSGIKVINGAIDVSAAYGKVRITSSGIAAIKTTDANGDPLKFAKLDGDGLTIRGGAFSISTAHNVDGSIPPDVSRVEITDTGIKAYDNGSQTFGIGSDGKVRIWNGELSLLPLAPNTGKIILNSDGIIGYKNATDKTVKIDSSTGRFSLYGGEFEIKTASEGSINQGLVFNHNGISAYRADNSRFMNLSIPDSKLYLYNGGFDISTAPEGQIGNKVTITGDGINILDEIGQKIVQMSGNDIPGEGVKMVISGGFKIKSEAIGSSVIIDENGILGTFNNSSFELTRGHDNIPPGLHIINGNISCGDVHINSDGISVRGSSGISIQSNDTTPITFVKMDDEGLKILEDRGIKIIGTLDPDSDGGSIVFYPDGMLPDSQPTVAISGKHGIHANAITVGVLTVTGTSEDNNPRIVVMDGEITRVKIEKTGIHIFDGSMSIAGPNGTVYMENGQIIATGLKVGLGGSNLIRNGRGGKLNTVPWEGDAQITTGLDMVIPGSSPETKAGISGRTAFQFNADLGQDFYQVIEDTAIGNKYIFSCWIYLISGSMDISFERPVGATPSDLDIVDPIVVNPDINQQYRYLQYQHVMLRLPSFTEEDIPPIVRFKATADGTYAFITDIMFTVGDMPSGFVNHSNELDASDSNVVIDDTGIKILNGKFSMNTILDTEEQYELTIDGLGLRLTKDLNNVFALNEHGFILELPSKSFVINDTLGMKVTSKEDSNRYVTLDEFGLTVKGGLISITSYDGSLKINSDSITVTHHELEKVRLDRNGLAITDGAFNLSSSSENAALQINNDQIVVKNGTGKEIVVIGNTNNKPGFGGMAKGILINGAGFKLTNTDGGGVVSISDQEIRIHHNNGTYSILTSEGLSVYKDGVFQPEFVCNYAKNVVISQSPIYSGQTITLGPMKNPKVLIVPAHFQTYHAESSYMNEHQHVKVSVVTGRDAQNNFRFTPYVTYPMSNTPQTALVWQSKGFAEYYLYEHAMGYTAYSTATRFGLYITYRGNHKTYHSDKDISFNVKIYWKSQGSSSESLVLNTDRNSDSDSTTKEWFWTGTYPPGTFRFDVYVYEREDGICNCVVAGVSYYADTNVSDSKITPQVNYLVVDG
jgi:fibronectin type 3 domain-containing protein